MVYRFTVAFQHEKAPVVRGVYPYAVAVYQALVLRSKEGTPAGRKFTVTD